MVTDLITGSGAAGLGTRIARLALVVVWSCGLASGIIDGWFSPPQPAILIAYVLLLASAVLLTRPVDAPLDPVRAGIVWACCLLATVIAVAVFPGAEKLWLADFPAYVLGLMSARGNVRWGASGNASQILIIVSYSLATGHPASVALAAAAVMSPITGVAWHYLLRWIVRRERAHRSAAALSTLEKAVADEAAATFDRELRRVAEEATPVLVQLREGRELDPRFRTEIAVLEGMIRDRIRSPGMEHPRIIEATAHARRRGARVTVLSNNPDLISDDTARELAGILLGNDAPRVDISSRAHQPGVYSVVLRFDDGGTTRASVGGPISRP